jgi:hypothetical protein
MRFLILLAFAFLFLGTARQSMQQAGPLPAFFTVQQETTGRWSDSEKHLLTDGVVVTAPVLKFEILPGFSFLLREFFFPRNIAILRVSGPLFRSAYFAKLFSTLIAINAP